jgi:hypothetical protein
MTACGLTAALTPSEGFAKRLMSERPRGLEAINHPNVK